MGIISISFPSDELEALRTRAAELNISRSAYFVKLYLLDRKRGLLDKSARTPQLSSPRRNQYVSGSFPSGFKHPDAGPASEM